MGEINVMINMMMAERQYDDDHHHHHHCQGARWDLNGGTIAESKLKELHPMMPVMYVKVEFFGTMSYNEN